MLKTKKKKKIVISKMRGTTFTISKCEKWYYISQRRTRYFCNKYGFTFPVCYIKGKIAPCDISKRNLIKQIRSLLPNHILRFKDAK